MEIANSIFAGIPERLVSSGNHLEDRPTNHP